MNENFFIHRGDTPKYQVVITHVDFDQVRDDFYVELSYGMMGRSVIIQKADMPKDEDDNFFLIFDSTDMVGFVKAACHYFVPDSDMDAGVREEVDYQYIGFSSSDPCPNIACRTCENGEGTAVVYTRVWRNDVNTLYLNVRTADGQPVMTSDGKQLRVHKTPEEIF